MTLHLLFKWILSGGGALLTLVVGAFVTFSLYVLDAKRAYAAMPDSHDLKARINKMGADYLAKRPNAALVIGFYQDGKSSFHGFGKISDSNTNPPDAQVIFEIGSVTKVFTCILLAKLADEGLVKLADPIGLYLPKNVVAPTKNGRDITLENLATHTSGLPRLPANLFSDATDRQNPYAGYSTRDLYDSLATVRLDSEPGSKSAYSNYGAGLLGKLLEDRTGKSYETLIQENICGPLGLRHTTTHLSAQQKSRLTPGHSPKGEVVPNWDFDALAGCGALRSNAEDLLEFIKANLGATNSTISKSLEEAQKFHFKKLSGGIGLGWQIKQPVERMTIHWHNGGTGGYVSFVGFDRANKIGVVVLSNYGDAWAGDSTVDKIGMDLLKIGSKISLE